MAKCLLTGATGFIGGRLLKLLDKSECDIRLISRTEVGDYETFLCNLEGDAIPEHAFESVDTVFHVAGLAHDLHDSNNISDLYYRVNVDATVKLANMASMKGVKRFVFVSSVKAECVSGSALSKHQSKNSQSDVSDIYSQTKREAELRLLEIGQASGMHVVIVRPALVYGPGVKGNLQLMLTGIRRGWFPPLPEINNKHSMIHVDDLVRAILLVAKEEVSNGEIFIATDGVPHSAREIYNAMCTVAGKSIPKWSVPKALFGFVGFFSPSMKNKFNKLLGNEYYSAAKLESLGFKAKKTLKDMSNETDF